MTSRALSDIVEEVPGTLPSPIRKNSERQMVVDMSEITQEIQQEKVKKESFPRNATHAIWFVVGYVLFFGLAALYWFMAG